MEVPTEHPDSVVAPDAADARWIIPVTTVGGALAFRGVCFVVMVWLSLWAEARPAPQVPDLVLQHVPYVPWVDRWNYVLWVVAYVPVALALLWNDWRRFARYTVTTGVLSVLRGLCIVATGLGPVRGADVNAGLSAADRWRALWEIASPVGVFGRDAAHVYLTKDLFFSGHTATTLILLLYVWRYPVLRWAMLAAHVAVVASVFLAHLHYTIDVIGAYAITFAVFVLREADVRRLLS